MNLRGLSLLYAAPEILLNTAKYGDKDPGGREEKAVDIYAMALVFFEIVFREKAWGKLSGKQVMGMVKLDSRPLIPERFNDVIDATPIMSKMVELMRSMWRRNPLERPTIDVVIFQLEKVE
jgi:hypothetical protein